MHSRVSAGGEVIVSGKKGFVTGGTIKSGKCIEAKTAGSVMGTQTNLEVGENMIYVEEERELMAERRVIKENMNKSEKIIFYISKKIQEREQLPPDKIAQFQQLNAAMREYKKRLEQIENRLDDLDALLENSTKGYVQVDDVIYPGCKVTVSTVTTYIKTETKHCRLVRDGADVRVTAFR